MSQLYTATILDDQIRDLIASVLRDVTDREYRFDADARREAFDAITRLHALEFMPKVREIAAMTLVGPDQDRYPDLVAVADALSVLTDLNDDSARSLNRSRLHDEPLRGFAIQNLTTLQAWEATDEVESELMTMEMSNANGNEVVSMLDFVLQSLSASRRVCGIVDRVALAYPDCARGNNLSRPSFCVNLTRLSVELRSTKCGRGD